MRTFITVAIGLLTVLPAFGEMYRCVDEKGKQVISDTPCPSGSKDILRRPPESNLNERTKERTKERKEAQNRARLQALLKQANERKEAQNPALALLQALEQVNDAVVAEIGLRSLPSDYKARIDAAFVGMLKDPDSRKIEYGQTYGSAVCGTVNARNAFGGYTGRQVFLGYFNTTGNVEHLKIYKDDTMGYIERQLFRHCGLVP